MAQRKKRNYEVSIWTLQDEFISVLKPFYVENKGQINNGKAVIKDDGTLELSFSIPMYYYKDLKRVENPIWYTTKNGVIVQDMRKIKLIFNKQTDVEKVFEFLITKVQESHKDDMLICEVTAEGLFFNELGKWGYKVSLSSEEFYARDYDFFTKGQWKDQYNIIHTEKPRGTLQYWLNHFLTPLPNNVSNLDVTKWYYTIEMDWSAYDGGRDSNKVYEDEYVASWNDSGTEYTPSGIVEAKEKERMVDLEESNAYNLTQNLAETFGVFCRYEYLYDSNYHIVGRKIIFYNNYVRENEGYIDLTYPYSTSAITRERDSKDITTKMYVRPVAEDSSASGLITILDVAANKSKEDYLLNFDYLRLTGGVTQEQYAEIDSYQYKIGKCNNQLKQIEEPLIALQSRVPELEAAITLHTNAIQLDKQRISASNELLNELDKTDGNIDGTITITNSAPRTAILKQSSNTDNNGAYYIDLTDHGIVLETLHIYHNYNFTNKRPDNELTSGTPEYDEFGNIIKVNNLFIVDGSSRTVYLTYNYTPQLYYERVLRTWQSRLGKDEAALSKTESDLVDIQENISTLQEQYETILAEKRALITSFDIMMGPALRESYWQPDEYTDYGDSYIDTFSFSSSVTTEIKGDSGYTELIWDTELFDDEQKTTYEYSSAQVVQYYPCIKLGSVLEYVKEHVNELSFMFYDYIPSYPVTTDVHNIRSFSVGSLCQYGFIKDGNNIEPVLIITGAESMSTEQITNMKSSQYKPKIGVLTTTVTSSEITTTIESSVDITPEMWVISSYPVYPRIKINSLALKTSTDMLGVTYNETELKNYEDYYVLTRDNIDSMIGTANAAYYITIKPQAILRAGSITAPIRVKFNLSNADIAIYLDAVQVLKENAFPKVSYTIKPSVIDEEFLYTLYNQLNRICNINDTDLKLENIQGYISELELDLDSPQNDRIEIKNYKTKFEDLFTSIVAQTEAMKKSAYTIGLAAKAFTTTGSIDEQLLQNSIAKVDLNYSFNNGKLTIDEKNGIWGISDSGVVAFRGGGIFTASQKDSAGNWKWNTGITPKGINANLITAGQLDTNNINIYAGDRVRFQLNGNGLFAYKSFFEDLDIDTLSAVAIEKINDSDKRMDDLDTAQYVVMNQNGLFLVGETGALVLNDDKTDYNELTQTVKRVEVSWEGFKLRNWNNQEVFWADQDTGNLNITGRIVAASGQIGGWNIEQNRLYSGTNTSYVGIDSGTARNNYAFWAGNGNAANAPFSVQRNGTIKANSGTIGGWTLTATQLLSGSGASHVAIDSDTNDVYALWAGADYPATLPVDAPAGSTYNAPFTVTKTGAIKAVNGAIGGWTLSANKLSSGSSNGYVAIDSNALNTYAIWAGDEIATNAPFSVTRGGFLKATAGNIGGWSLENTTANGITTKRLYSGTDTGYVALDSGSTNMDYAIWAGNTMATSASFRVKRDGTVYLTKLKALGEPDPVTEIRPEVDVNLAQYPWWKLNYSTIRSHTETSITLTDGTTVNFKTAASFALDGYWSNGAFVVDMTDLNKTQVFKSYSSGQLTRSLTDAQIKTAIEGPTHMATLQIEDFSFEETLFNIHIDASGVYEAGQRSVTLSAGLPSYGKIRVSASSPNTNYIDVDWRTVNAISAITLSASDTGSAVSKTVNVSYDNGDATIGLSVSIDASAVYEAGYSYGHTIGVRDGEDHFTSLGSHQWGYMSGSTFMGIYSGVVYYKNN